jgi:60 kDa SS-A/Ro ribonucleoprotein
MKNLAGHLGDPRRTSPREPIPGREAEMHRGPAGGYVFKTGDWERLDRFLIIGTEGGTYYADERSHTRDNADVVRRCLTADHPRVLARTMEVSEQGLAPKNDPAILALVLSFLERGEGVPTELRRKALQRICRTGTHLFQFLEAVRGMRGGGRSLNGAVRAWMNDREIERLALQMAKYRNRAGWTWKDVLRRYRPKPPQTMPPIPAELGQAAPPTADERMRAALYAWAAGKPYDQDDLPSLIFNMERAAEIPVEELAHFVDINRLPWECVPSEHTTRKDVLGALFTHMPVMATVRQLSKLQAHGVLEERRADAIARLHDREAISKSRIHPVALMLAASAYEVGHGRNLTWTPDPAVVDALDDAFQLALEVAEPTGKELEVWIDASGSMHRRTGFNNIPLFKLAAAFALTYVRTDNARVFGFDAEPHHFRQYFRREPSLAKRAGVYPLAFSERQRVTDAARMIEALGQGGGTDCGLPFKHAREAGRKVDTFVCFTDNESWAGGGHPAQELQLYRDAVNPNAKVVWCAMTAGGSSLSLPDDPRVLGIAGFDSSAPQLVGNFAADRF